MIPLLHKPMKEPQLQYRAHINCLNSRYINQLESSNWLVNEKNGAFYELIQLIEKTRRL